MLNEVEKGKGLPEDFNKNRIFNANAKFHKAIIKNDCKSFMNLKKSCIVKNKKNDDQVTMEVNRNILGALKSFCLKKVISVEYKKALGYPLNPNALNICHPDGQKRPNKNSDTKNILFKPVKNFSLEEVESMCSTVVNVDVIGLANNINSIPGT